MNRIIERSWIDKISKKQMEYLDGRANKTKSIQLNIAEALSRRFSVVHAL